MLRRTLLGATTALIIISIAVPFVQAAPTQNTPPPPERDPRSVDLVRVEEGAPPEAALEKIAPSLRELAQAGGKESVPVAIEVKAGMDLSHYLSDYFVRPFVFRGNQIVYGTVQANDLLTLAAMAEVTAIGSNERNPGQMVADNPYQPAQEPDSTARQARLAVIRAVDVPFSEAPAREVNAEGWFEVLVGHKSSEAWKKGFTGDGVIVGVIDDGIDFGHPDLVGTTARVTDPASPYYGWPMAFSETSMYGYALDVLLGTFYVHNGGYGIWYADTSETRTVAGNFGGTAVIEYTPLTGYATWGDLHEYTIPATSQSHVAHIGSFPDADLEQLYGERVAVLVMDEGAAGVYDTVYVDLDNDYDFTDEKPAYLGDEYIYRDMDGDGYADISGGMVQWISDGENPLPIADWLWGLGIPDNGVQDFGEPDAGDLVMFSGAYDFGYSHGTNCASNIAGQGVVNGGLSAQPFRVGGMVQGAAPDAGLMNFGDFYRTPSGPSQDDVYLVAALGYDGIPYTDDETQINTNSYGEFGSYFANWSYYDRFIADVNHTLGGNTTYVFSYGNDGPGFGTNEGAAGVTTLKVGASTQYGSTNWDSIASADQIVYGDSNSWGSKGPDFDGSVAPDILANGDRGSGSSKINYGPYNGHMGFDGWTSWETWGGTSRSAPVAGGNLALVYQAYKDRYGVWPTYQMAQDLLMAGANDAKTDPTLQGAGVVNADRATDLAAGIYGVYATPTMWNVGDYRGANYESFAHMVSPGDTVSQTFTVQNPSGYDITVGLSDGILTQIGDAIEIPFTSSHLEFESGYSFHAPDYLIPITPTLIPADTDLMVVRLVQPLTMFDPDGDYTTENFWRNLVYNWTDLNGDGMLWEDKDDNGVVNHVDDVAAGLNQYGDYRPDFDDPETEIQEGEYIRFARNSHGNTNQITIRDPLERMADGMFIGLQHQRTTPDLPISSLTFYLEFYQRVDWDWLSLSDTSVTVEAWDTMTFTAAMAVPTDTAYGFYDGYIFIADPGDSNHDAHITRLPVGVDVAAELGDAPVTLGGGAATNRMYDNNIVRGLGAWEQGGWSILGDWRHFFVDVPTTAFRENSYLVVHSDWEGDAPTDDWALGTDIDTYVLGPCNDGFAPQAGDTPDPIFGPYGLEVKGTSRLDNRGGGLWAFSTWTGDTEDWALAPLDTEGLYEIGLHNGLFAGDEPEASFTVTVGTLSMGVDLGATPGEVGFGSIDATVYADSGTVNVWFTSTLELADLNANLSGGLADTMYGPFTSYVPDSGQCYSAWCADNVYEPFMVAAGTTRIVLHLNVPGGEDADLFLVYDADDDGVAEQADDEQVGSSGNPTGTDEEITLNNPRAGRYFAALDGFDVTDPGVDLDWWYRLTAPGPLPVDAAEIFSSTVAVAQDARFDFTTASFSTTVTMDHNIAALYATLTEVDPADIDLYVTDETGAVVVRSQTWATATEAIALTPPVGEYRFEDGAEYTVWVHGYDVSTPPADVHLNVTWDVLNVWLSAEHADVHVAAIGVGEGVSLTLHFDKPGWLPGDSDLSARLTAGPDGFETAFDGLVTLTRDDPPVAAWNPANLDISITADSIRGAGAAVWNVGDVPIPTALVAAGERVTYTVSVGNLDPLVSPDLIVDAWPLPQDYLATYFGVPGQTDGVAYGLITGTAGTIEYTGGITWTGTISSGDSIWFSYWVEMPADMEPGDNHTSGVDVYDSGWDWFGWALAGGYYRSFRTTGSYKMSSASTVLPGETFTYTISLQNPSAEDRYVYLSDPLPDEVTYVSSTGDAVYDAGTHTVSWDGLLPGTSLSTIEFDIAVMAETDLVYNTLIENDASLSHKQDGTPFAHLTANTTVGTGAGLEIEKTVDAINGLAGDTLNYTIVFSNTGIETACGVAMTDTVPAKLDVITGTVAATKASTGIYDLYEDGLIRWEGDLASGEAVTVTFQATINDTAAGGLALINAARATASNYPTEMYNSALTEVTELYAVYLPLVLRNSQ